MVQKLICAFLVLLLLVLLMITNFAAPSINQPDFSAIGYSDSPYPTHSLPGDFTPPNSLSRERTLGDSVDYLESSPSRFSLPSPTKSYDEFNSEEAELRALVNEADEMFPHNLSYGVYYL